MSDAGDGGSSGAPAAAPAKAAPAPVKAAGTPVPAPAAPVPKTRAAPAGGAAVPEPPPWWRTLRSEPPGHMRALLGLAMIAFVLLVWWFVTRGEAIERIISPSRLPSPGEVFGSLGKLMDRAIGKSVGDTLERVFVGVGMAALVGVTVGVIASAVRGVGAALNPLIIFLRSVPMGALIPLTLLLFSDGARQKTMFLFLALVGFVISDTVKAIMSIPERFVETAQTLGATRFQIVTRVLVPLALPDIITSLRFQLGLALGYVMLAEEINVQYGLGQMIMNSQRQGITEHVYLLVFIIALIAFTLDLILRTLQRGLFSWRKDL